MNQDEQRELENRLVAMGMSGVNDPEMLTVFARIIEDFPGDKHWFYRGMINECEPAKRRDMYYSLKARFTSFKPLPLETYLAQIAERASEMVSHRIIRVEGPAPGAVNVGGEYYVDAKEGTSTHTAVKLTCSKCTKQKVFIGTTFVDAIIKARKKGWVKDQMNDKDVCPKCPAVRNMKVGRA